MSMVTEFVRLRPAELDELRRLLADDPDQAFEYAGDLAMGDPDEEVSSRCTDTDQAWAGLRYLLSAAGAPVDVVGGGSRVTDDIWAYDSPRLLSADEVAEAARFLTTTPFATLAAHYDAAQLKAADVYPSGLWEAGADEALSYLDDRYARLVALFDAAAADGEPILVWLD
jgi:hypothetical protein